VKQPDYYLITFDELQELKPNVAEGMYRSTQEMRQEETISQVLSRKYTPTTGEKYTGVCAVQDNCTDYSDFIESVMDELKEGDEDPVCPIKCEKRVDPQQEMRDVTSHTAVLVVTERLNNFISSSLAAHENRIVNKMFVRDLREEIESIRQSATSGVPSIAQEYTFGYFPRNKYKDLVFYVKGYQGKGYLNYGLFEMPDTPENRELMEILSRSHTQAPEQRKLAETLVKELNDHWLIMGEENIEPLTKEFEKIISGQQNTTSGENDNAT